MRKLLLPFLLLLIWLLPIAEAVGREKVLLKLHEERCGFNGGVERDSRDSILTLAVKKALINLVAGTELAPLDSCLTFVATADDKLGFDKYRYLGSEPKILTCFLIDIILVIDAFGVRGACNCNQFWKWQFSIINQIIKW